MSENVIKLKVFKPEKFMPEFNECMDGLRYVVRCYNKAEWIMPLEGLSEKDDWDTRLGEEESGKYFSNVFVNQVSAMAYLIQKMQRDYINGARFSHVYEIVDIYTGNIEYTANCLFKKYDKEKWAKDE